MKKQLYRLIAAVFVCTACFVLNDCRTFAAPAELELPVSVTLEGTLPEKADDYVIKLQGENIDTPMPEGAIEGLFSLTVSGEATKNFPAFSFDKVGIYNYQIWQEAGSNPECTYDKSLYKMTIYVTNNKSYDGFDMAVAIYKESETTKQPELVFHNVYKTEKPKTGDTANSALWLMVLMASMVSIAYIISKKYKDSMAK